jgi:AMP-binding enzyme C-terminal domain
MTDDAFFRAGAARLYEELTDGYTRALRVERLVEHASARWPDQVPSPERVEAERAHLLADKEPLEIAWGLLIAHVLADPAAGRHLVWSMLRPTDEALARVDAFRAAGELDLGKAHVHRDGRVGVLELRNPRHLNAEDDATVPATEVGVDLLLLDPDVETVVFRGGVVDHPRYAGRRIFGSGINLTHLYRGQIAYLFFVVRDLGFVNKIYRGGRHRGQHREARELGLTALNTYGLSEIVGPGVSAECPQARDGLHVQEDHFLVEEVEGELVITTLTKEALPLLRYRTGDIASLTYEQCRCGRTLARMSAVRGRRDDMLIVRGVNLYPSEVERILLAVDGIAPHYQLILRREGALDELTVRCEPAGAGAGGARLAARAEHALREETGITIRVELLGPGSVPRSEGKAVRVIDER